ncbi:hypothetical protein ABVK25_007675 [Lepraria finkii]|uniref:Uncharacterized protein n=1 Tax=Lepraria finkii TaxID=1340010 RepID=A0ABR4B847_9LECA
MALAKDPATEPAKEPSHESAQASSEEPTKVSTGSCKRVLTNIFTRPVQPPKKFKQQLVTTLLRSAPEQLSEPNARSFAQEPSPEPAKGSVLEGTPGIPSQTGPTNEPAPQWPEQSTSGLVKEPAQEPAEKPIPDSLIDPELLKLSKGQPAITSTQEPAKKSLLEPTKKPIQGLGSEPTLLNAQTIHPDTPKSTRKEHPAKDSNQEPVSEFAQQKAQPISLEASISTAEE